MFPPGAQVLHLGAVVARLVEGERGRLLVGQRQVEAIAEFEQVALVEFFLAVRGHPALGRNAHPVALLGVRQDDGGLTVMAGRRCIRRMNLHQIVPAALQAVDLLVGHPLRQPRQFFVLAEEVVAVETAVLGGKGLHLAVDGVGKRAGQRAAAVAGEQPVPVAAPDQLDDIPAGAGEKPFQFVDDAAIAAHRAVQALQVAVDDPHQVVQALARGERQRAHRFGLVHFAVAEDTPHLALRAVLQLAVGEVAHEPRVIDRTDRTDPHRPGGKLPEVGHQPRMRIARQPARAGRGRGEFLPVVHQVALGQPAFEEGTGVDPRRAVRLEEHQVAALPVVGCREEVIETYFEQIRGAGIARDMAAQFTMVHVGARHHRQRIPAHQRGKPFFDRQIAGKNRLLVDGNRIDVRRVELRLPAHADRLRQPREFIEHEPRPFRAMRGDQSQERVAPLGGFAGIGVGQRCFGRAEQRIALVVHLVALQTMSGTLRSPASALRPGHPTVSRLIARIAQRACP